ncbi:hypothetical protein ANN_10443 [Periplaneta americana]|uniref:Tc1-like transposase DDE domain-containing protein n=1 Tax=Periplaneta americana TaxID=6978 RepID=A0ABQ8TRU6_PERAM|nr:hypothetical protein ANN_10443 [Periplaneta americana]
MANSRPKHVNKLLVLLVVVPLVALVVLLVALLVVLLVPEEFAVLLTASKLGSILGERLSLKRVQSRYSDDSFYFWQQEFSIGQKEDLGVIVSLSFLRGSFLLVNFLPVLKQLLSSLLSEDRLASHKLRSLPSKETLRGHSDSSFRGEGYIQCCVGVRLCDMYSNQELAEINFLENTIPHVLEDTPLNNRQHIHFLHDGAPAHFNRTARRYLDRRFPARWTGRSGPIAWPPRSPDLNPLDFYLWGHLKLLVYSSPVPDLESLRNRIVACSEDIRNTPGVWDRVRRSMRHRCEVCIQAGGGHFEHLL